METPLMIPGALAIALQTGRPELARLGIEGTLPAGVTKDIVATISDYAESIVRDIEQERANMKVIAKALPMARSNLRGALKTVERLEEALRQMLAGAPPDSVRAALRNPNGRDEEDA